MTDPSDASFGFLLVAGDSFAVTQLRKRDGLPDPFVFINCPASVNENDSKDEIHTARVVCLSNDLAGCFRVMERGVEGTLVEMPEDCAPNTFARALSLDLSMDQYVPEHIAKRSPTSQVFEFSFDFNIGLMRRDTNNTSVRLDYSNLPGYWDSIVDSPGIQTDNLEKRFFGPRHSHWRSQYEGTEFAYSSELATRIHEVIDAPLFWQAEEDCPHGTNLRFGEGFGAYVDGHIDANLYYGFSMIGTMNNRNDGFIVRQASGFLKLTGTMDITYGIGGIGTVDISSAGKGNPAISDETEIKLTGKTITAGRRANTASFDPYVQLTYQMATFNDTDDNDFGQSAAPFDGRLTARVVTDLGNMGDSPVIFPSDESNAGDNFDSRSLNNISISDSDVLYGSPGVGGKIALGTFIKFGLKVSTSFWDWRPEPLDVSKHHRTLQRITDILTWPSCRWCTTRRPNFHSTPQAMMSRAPSTTL